MVEHRAGMDAVFGALAHGARRAMLDRLAAGERSVGELAEPLEMSLAAASKHVKILERAGLIRRTVVGRTHWCRLDPGPLADAVAWLRVYERHWSERLDALEALFTDPDGPGSDAPGPEAPGSEAPGPGPGRRSGSTPTEES